MYVVKHDYTSRAYDDMSLNKGDRLCIISTNKKGWWLALSLVTGKKAYVPINLIAKLSFPVYLGSYDYNSDDDEELSFKRDEELCIVHTGSGDWWYACSLLSGMEGFVPRNYIIESSLPVYAALYDFEARTSYDVGFKKCDLFYVIDDSDKDWLLARSRDSKKEGYIPSNYLAKVNTMNIHK